MRAASLLALLLLAALPARAEELLVSAAVSLSAAFQEIGKGFAAANPGARPVFNFAASGALLQQIERGAPVDVFAPADQETMDVAQRKGLVAPATRRDFALNRLVLVVPARAQLPIAGVADLEREPVRRIAIGNPSLVPAGRYARDALGEGLLQRLRPKLIFAESARQALQYVARGEVDAAFVYASDAAAAGDRVEVVVALPTPKPIAYPVAVVAASARQALARRFIEHLRSPAAQEVLRRHGFGG